MQKIIVAFGSVAVFLHPSRLCQGTEGQCKGGHKKIRCLQGAEVIILNKTIPKSGVFNRSNTIEGRMEGS